MTQSWKEKLSCATACHRCSQALAGRDRRILSVYDHEPICLDCKAAEERRPDYESVSKEAVGQCLADTEAGLRRPRRVLLPSLLPVHVLRTGSTPRV